MRQITVTISDDTFKRLQELVELTKADADGPITVAAFAEESIIQALNGPVCNMQNPTFTETPELKLNSRLWEDDRSVQKLRSDWQKEGALFPRSEM